MRVQVLAIAVAAGVATQAGATGFISEVDPGTLTTNTLEDFESLIGGGAPGTNYDSVISLSGISFGERFDGQGITDTGGFDSVPGLPTGPLTLVAGAAGQNLHVITAGGSNVLDGLGAAGFPNLGAIGEGAIAILFDSDQFEFGLTLAGVGPGASVVEFDFYARDGSLIESTSLFPISSGAIAFRRAGDVEDIAGVVMTNLDPSGLAIDNVRFNVVIPTPGSLTLLAIAVLAARRRRR